MKQVVGTSSVYHEELEYSKGEVSSMVIKAYVVSLLLLLAALVWFLGDSWVLYAQSIFMPVYHFRFFSSSSASTS